MRKGPFLKAIFQTPDLFVGVLDEKGKLIDANQEVLDFIGKNLEDVRGNKFWTTAWWDHSEKLQERLKKEIKQANRGEEVRFESDHFSPGGKSITVDFILRSVEIENGSTCFLALGRDITDLKQAKKKHQIMTEGSSQAIYLFQSGRFKYINDSFEKLSGYTKEELNDIGFLKLIHPDDREKIAKWTQQALKGDDSGLPKRVEYKVLTKDGETIWLRTLPSLIKYEGKPAIVGNTVDITKEKEMEKELRSERDLLESIMTLTPDLVYFKDDQHRFERVNEGYTDLLGLDEEEMIGKTAEDFWPEAEEIMDDERRALSGEPVIGRERKVTLPDGEKRWYSINKLPRCDGEGNIIGFLGMDRDITKRKRTEQALDEERNKLKNLHSAVEKLQQQNSEEDMAQTAVDVAEKMLDFELCAISVLKDDLLVPKANSSELDADETNTFKIGEGITGKTAQRGETIWGNDLRDHPEAKPTNDNFRAFISVPIGDMGVFQVISKETGSFSKRDVELAEILSNHLSEELRRARLEEDLKEQAIRDPLTDLYNRRYFNVMLKEEVKKAERYDKPLAFLMLDVNKFKEVNDHYSHQTGDKALQRIASLLSENVRDADTVVRYGGDEFLVMMPETEREVEEIVNRLQKALERWNSDNSLIDFPLTLAMGVSHWDPSQDRDVEAALNEADRKMYENKER